MKTPSLDAEITRFIVRYLEVSGLSTATTVTQQRIDYEAMVHQFSYPHPVGIRTRDSRVAGRHADIALRHYYHGPGNDSALILIFARWWLLRRHHRARHISPRGQITDPSGMNFTSQ
jgi:hypothetical protein